MQLSRNLIYMDRLTVYYPGQSFPVFIRVVYVI
jgi:hypothetical protein